MADTVVTVQEVGIDWITASAPGAGAGARLGMLGERIVGSLAGEGYKRRRWSKWGYVGESARYASFGRSGEDAVIVLSGAVADEWVADVVDRAANVSRIDLQVTVKTDPPWEGVARKLYEQFSAAGPGGRRGAVADWHESTDGGSTAYLGRRISDKFFRCYDKWRESDDEQYRGCWRYEIEIKNAPADSIARRLAHDPDRANLIRATVHKHVASHGGRPIFTACTDGLLLPAPRPNTDLERRVDWLAKSVSKTAQEVAVCLGPMALMRILGCDELSTSTSERLDGGVHGHHSYESYPDRPD